MSGVSRPFRVALIQMRCSSDPEDNLRRGWRCSARRQHRERRSSACRSCSGRSTSARARTPALSTWPSRFPGRPPRRWPESRREAGWSSSARSSRGARPASTTTRRWCSTPTARSAAVTARCTSPTTRSTTRSITSRPATSASGRFRHAFARIGTLVCWDQWYPEAARLTALQGAEILFYPTAIGWHPAEKAEFGAAQATPGRPSSAPRHRQRRLRRRGQPGRPRRTRGGRPRILGRLVPGRSVRPGPGQGRRSDTEEILVVACDPRLQEETRRNWPFLRDRRIDAYGPITTAIPGHRNSDHSKLPRRPAGTGVERDLMTPAAARLPHARRMGAARGHLDRLAAQPRRLARQVRAHSLGLRRDRPPSQPGRDRVASWSPAAG